MARRSKGDNATVERQLADLDDLPADGAARSKPLADALALDALQNAWMEAVVADDLRFTLIRARGGPSQ